MTYLTYMTHLGGGFYLILNVYKRSSCVLAEVQGRQTHIQSECRSQTWWKRFNVINLPPVSWQIYPGNGAIVWTWRGCLLLEKKILHNGCSYSLWRWTSVLLSPRITSTQSTMATLFLRPLDNDRSQDREWLVPIEEGILRTPLAS